MRRYSTQETAAHVKVSILRNSFRSELNYGFCPGRKQSLRLLNLHIRIVSCFLSLQLPLLTRPGNPRGRPACVPRHALDISSALSVVATARIHKPKGPTPQRL